jgi:hypothetical protein
LFYGLLYTPATNLNDTYNSQIMQQSYYCYQL